MGHHTMTHALAVRGCLEKIPATEKFSNTRQYLYLRDRGNEGSKFWSWAHPQFGREMAEKRIQKLKKT